MRGTRCDLKSLVEELLKSGFLAGPMRSNGKEAPDTLILSSTNSNPSSEGSVRILSLGKMLVSGTSPRRVSNEQASTRWHHLNEKLLKSTSAKTYRGLAGLAKHHGSRSRWFMFCCEGDSRNHDEFCRMRCSCAEASRTPSGEIPVVLIRLSLARSTHNHRWILRLRLEKGFGVKTTNEWILFSCISSLTGLRRSRL